jgi:uncharacterized protein YjlB
VYQSQRVVQFVLPYLQIKQKQKTAQILLDNIAADIQDQMKIISIFFSLKGGKINYHHYHALCVCVFSQLTDCLDVWYEGYATEGR